MDANHDPFSISSKSRSKLNSFRYVESKDEPSSPKQSPSTASLEADNAHKENQSSKVNGVVEPPQSQSGQGKPSTQTKESKPAKECPQTPAPRIPLAELISNTEDAFRLAPGKEVTPDDHVIWLHVPRSSDPDNRSASPVGRGKKRRHSSSPGSSPLTARKEPFDMQKFQSLMKTPQNDVAADLWNNYVGKIKGTVDVPPPRFTNLLSSSPLTPASAKTSRDSSGLRRSVSCTADWPTSRAKRRRVAGGEETRKARDLFSRSKSNVLDSVDSKSSRINFLVGKIQESLSKSARARGAGPSSSSPLRERTDDMGNRSPSPAEKRRRNLRAAEQTHQNSVVDESEESRNDSGSVQEVVPQGSSSEFGDDDLDQDLLELAEAAMDPSETRIRGDEEKSVDLECRTTPGPEQPAPSQVDLASVNRNDATFQTSNTNAYKDDDDEFDDGDDDFPDNIEEIMAQFEKEVPAQQKQLLPEDQPEPEVAATTADSTGLGTNAEGHAEGSKNAEGISSDDEFDDDDFDLEAIENSMLQSGARDSSQNHKARKAIKRYLVIDIAESTYVTRNGRTQPEQVLLVQDEKTQQKKVIVLRESWFDTPCTKDSYIHLIGDFDAAGQCVVDNSNNMIILHPDHLISATVVADSISCQRRAVLQDRIKVFGELGKPQVFGTIFHEVFQEALKANKWDLDWLRTTIEDILIKYLDNLYAIHVSMPEAVEYVMSKMPDLKAWAAVFLKAKPTAESLVEDRNGSKGSLSINKLLEVEEHIWSPMYGLKGNIDATVQVAYHDGEEDRTLVVPLELKTGKKDSQAHRAQTALYTLLLSDRYDIEVTFGLLYYLETTRTLRIRGIRHEILQMIQQRNRLSVYVRERLELPPMVRNSRLCSQCYAKIPCFLYHKLLDDGDGETSGMGDKFLEVVGHLTPQHRDFFRKWDDLLTKEEKDMMKFRRELWTMLSSERESLGRCFSNVIIEPGSAYEDKDGPKINRYRYTFIKQKADPDFSFTESQITVGEPIVISDEKGHFALANGYVLQVSPKRITVAVDRRLHNTRTRMPGFHPERNQTFKGIMEVVEERRSESTVSGVEPEEPMLYRLDKDEFSNGMATVRNNLLCMMEKDLFQAKQLRRLIIEGQPPSFKPSSSAYVMSSSARANLNVDQKRAIDKIMSAQDYALVLGMPGTGKTTIIAHIIRALVAQGKSVLLTSYTHTAVDNILLKIRDDNFRILRIGATAKVHPEVQQFAELAAVPKKTIEELKESYEQSNVVATTCLGINHPIFDQRTFDYCIVDEASQITLPVCLGPIRMAKTFILVGDHYQLPPLVQNKEAQEGGLDVSLFKLLSDAQPSSVVNLEHQYRMCEEIMLLSNTLVYSGRLKCGTPEVASRSLKIPNIAGLKQHHANPLTLPSSGQSLCLGRSQGRCWLRDMLEPSAKTLLVNTDTLVPQALETAHGSRIMNTTEAALCTQLVEAFISCGISAREIGVITFYRSQLALLKQNLRRHLPELEMHTADKFQGRDKEVVILSCVRSNSEKHVGDLLRDWRRVNVAFTRARTKLLVVGSKSTLRDGNELLGKYVALVEKQGWIYDLPKDAVESHVFENVNVDLSWSQQPTTVPQMSMSPSPSSSPKATNSGSPEQKQKNKKRSPLSPVQARQQNPGARTGTGRKMKTPEKRGARLLDGEKITSKRPVLRDVVNDLVG